jgi:hypothetical protein
MGKKMTRLQSTFPWENRREAYSVKAHVLQKKAKGDMDAEAHSALVEEMVASYQ